ncbi:hypothetical protein B4N89_27915 [Embleya scabrispora]|uniref:Uncharacterized protein n=1 Tax=Embleya scabrispora TaxID=159449 RepID=A0A1T3P5M6_9ACTN|nr:hypothetical protein [Embleya scabrispora]OPC84245.1 hypothetical protein B4N89_27915 [Embleya scabrispora]
MNFLDVHRGLLTWRQVRVMIEKLPPESATWTAIRNDAPEPAADDPPGRPPEEGRWSQVEMLLAAVLEAIRDLHHHEICVNWDTSKAPRPAPPDRIRRPGWRPPTTQLDPSPAWARALFDAIVDGPT